jgi:hypothetical protein
MATENSIASRVESQVDAMAEHKHHNKKHHAKKHTKQHHAASLAQTGEKKAATPAKPAPVAKNLLKTKAKNQDEFDKFSQNVDVPIDEVKAITLKVAPTYNLDQVESVTLKSFRKVVGYDTFNSILKGDRAEKKDVSDHYNVTVSMMIRRIPPEVSAAPARDPYNGGKSLAESLDKGFPYDDGDISPDNMTPNLEGQALSTSHKRWKA